MEPTQATASQTTRSTRVDGALSWGAPDGVLAALDELLALGVGLLPPSSREHLCVARARLAEQRLNLVVLGEFKRGKSTLINALLGRDVLPTGVVPLTSVVTAIASGERERLLVSYADASEHECPIAEIGNYVTEAGNPGNRLGVKLARVELGHELLRDGIELIDTPGIGSIHAHNTEVARGFLPQVDAAVCVLDAGQPLTEAERELVLEAARRVPRLLIVVNKVDHLDHDERQVAIDFVRSAVDELLGDVDAELRVVSARTGEGVPELAARLHRLAGRESRELLLRSVAGLGAAAAADVVQAARFETRAIALPLDELRSRARIFELRIGELDAARTEAADLLDRGIERALAQHLNEPLSELAEREEARLRAALREGAQRLGARSPKDLSNELDGFIETTVRAEFDELVVHFEAAIADQLTDLESRYAMRVRTVLEQVQEIAEHVFGTRASEALPPTGLAAPSRFSFKLQDVEHALDVIVGFGRTITPGALGRRLVVRDAEQRLIEMTDRHAGRLRSELAARATEAARQYARELDAVIGEAIAAIRTAIDRAEADRRRGERHARARLDDLSQVERRCQALGEDFARVSTNGYRRAVAHR